jgi:glycerol uptake facilitator-like aquaporin
MKKYIAEALGTGALTLAVGLSLKVASPFATPVLAALVLGLFVYSIGHISGTHLNPAVTIGAWTLGKIKGNDVIMYIVSQCVGAGLALFIISSTVGMAVLTVSNSWPVALAELLGTFFFTFGIASVIYEKTPRDASGVVIGGSLFLGIAIAAFLGSNGILNPALAFGTGSLNIAYILGPIIGSIFGMQAYKYLANE